MPFCSNCGAEVQSSQKFCPNCGSPVQITKHLATTRKPQGRSGIIGIFDIVVGGVYLILAVLTLIVPGTSVPVTTAAFFIFLLAGATLTWFGYTVRRVGRGTHLIGTVSGVTCILIGYILVSPGGGALLIVLGMLGFVLGTLNLALTWVNRFAKRVLPAAVQSAS